ncbi:hypothetical protein NDU88_006829 [Pleurodeles waltl]|uniref:Uncharacterized protein n=1 Tax=Pleurodeles waltl TaxID=8319 RepID=A0AAV7PJG7_PLEWA|nr:hypothetical protein NDU88_006829 [Pleurodeles waltl]
MAGPQRRTSSPGALALGGQRTKTTMGGPATGPARALARGPAGPLNPNWKGKPPWSWQTPRPEPLGVLQAEGREHPPQGPVGAEPGPLNLNRQGMLTWTQWNPRPGPFRVRQAGGSECPSQGPEGARGTAGAL